MRAGVGERVPPRSTRLCSTRASDNSRLVTIREVSSRSLTRPRAPAPQPNPRQPTRRHDARAPHRARGQASDVRRADNPHTPAPAKALPDRRVIEHHGEPPLSGRIRRRIAQDRDRLTFPAVDHRERGRPMPTVSHPHRPRPFPLRRRTIALPMFGPAGRFLIRVPEIPERIRRNETAQLTVRPAARRAPRTTHQPRRHPPHPRAATIRLPHVLSPRQRSEPAHDTAEQSRACHARGQNLHHTNRTTEAPTQPIAAAVPATTQPQACTDGTEAADCSTGENRDRNGANVHIAPDRCGPIVNRGDF